MFHIINNFDIPIGVARYPQGLRYYYKSYDNQTFRMVKLKAFDLDAEQIKMLSTKGEQPIVDMTPKFK